MSDAEADGIARRICGVGYRDVPPTLAASEKKVLLARMRSAGISIRQIERSTGIGRAIIANAKL